MGFLDRMLAGAIEQSTGFKARGLVRMIGGRRLLMLGGAALAGGMMAQSAQSLGGGGRSTTGRRGTTVPPTSSAPRAAPPVMPPLPPTPTAGAPDLPPVPTLEEQPATAEEALFEVAALRTVVAAALADGEIGREERELLQEHLGNARELSSEQRAAVQSELLQPARPQELARALPAGEDPTPLLALSIAMLRADGEMDAVERAWLGSLAAAYGVAESRLGEIEAELFED